MADPLQQQIVPIPRAQAEEILILNQIAFEFRDELAYRHALEQYGQWYQKIAEQNRRDLSMMRREINLFWWLGLRKRR